MRLAVRGASQAGPRVWGTPVLSCEVARPGVFCPDVVASSRASVSPQTPRATELILSVEQASSAIRVGERVQINSRPQDREQAPNKDLLPNPGTLRTGREHPETLGPYSTPRLFASLSGPLVSSGDVGRLLICF